MVREPYSKIKLRHDKNIMNREYHDKNYIRIDIIYIMVSVSIGAIYNSIISKFRNILH